MDISKYNHIIWDWNGTLLDDAWLCVEIINTFLEDRNLPRVSLEQYRGVFTFPVRSYYKALGFDFQRESWETVSTAFISAYEKNRSRCLLMPGAKAILDRINSLGIDQSILSASKLEYLQKAVVEYGLEGIFIALNGLDNHHAAGKTEIGKAFIIKYSLNSTEVLLIGDTLHDVEVASAIEADCCLVSNGHQALEKLVKSGVPVIKDLSEIVFPQEISKQFY